MRELYYLKFFFNQVESFERSFTNEQMGKLFFALGHYAMRGQRDEVEPEIRYAYDHICRGIDKIRNPGTKEAESC